MNVLKHSGWQGGSLKVAFLSFIIVMSFLINAYLFHQGAILGINSPAKVTMPWSDENAPISMHTHSSYETTAESIVTSNSSKRKRYEYEPLSCRELLQQVKNGSLATPDPNGGKGYIRLTSTDPKFWISLHNSKVDRMRWSVYERGDYYESILTSAIKEGLMEYPGGMFLDVGGNIGWFSLWAAALGRSVSVFEPNPINYMRLCESMNLNGWSNPIGNDAKIDMYPFGVGSQHGDEFVIKTRDADNPGASSLARAGNSTPGTRVKVVSLDEIAEFNGWFRGDTTIAFMKVDVEGQEPEVFMGAQRLMTSKIVKNIAFEYNKPQYNAAGHDIIQQLGDYGYELHKVGLYKGPRILNIPQANETLKDNLERVTGSKTHNVWLKLKRD